MARYDAALATQGVTDAQRFGPIRAQVLVVQEEFRLRGIQVEQSKYDQATIHLVLDEGSIAGADPLYSLADYLQSEADALLRKDHAKP